MEPGWLLLIYTVPSAPSRKRAAVWRGLKQAGAVYLRDGVCALPRRAETANAFQALAAQVEAFGGEATLVEVEHLDERRAAAIAARSREERGAEYAELEREAERFLEHVRRETAHRAFTCAEVEELAADLGKLARWAAQIRARDYFGAAEARGVAARLARCDAALAGCAAVAASHDGGAR
jgi:hypothetical protein